MLFLRSFWEFSRPHTIIGTSLSVIALYLMAVATTHRPLPTSALSTITDINLWQGGGAWLACICGNIYIVGLNQLYDIEIDRVNKPHLPLASGEFSLSQGQWMVGISGLIAMVIAASLSPWLLATVGISLLLGTAYSLPPMRLKRFSFWAAFCILVVRGVVINVGLFTYFYHQITNTLSFPPLLWIVTLFILVFTIAIAIFKDVPDLEGDQKFQIQTFTISWGKPAILSITRGVITSAYLGMIIAGLCWLPTINTVFFSVVHGLLLGLLWWRSRNIDLEDKVAIGSFYQFIWKLFFLEYLILPVACFLPF